MTIKYLTATVFIPNGKGSLLNDNKVIQTFPVYICKKYIHNIKDTQHYIGKFCNDMKVKFPTAEYINFYYKHNGEFKERINLE